MNVKKALLALRSMGLRKVIDILGYSLRRDRLDRPYLQQLGAQNGAPASWTPPGRLAKAHIGSRGARFEFEHAQLEVQFLADDLVRIAWEPGLPPLPYAIAKEDWPVVEIRVEPSGAGYRLSSPDLEVDVEEDGSLIFRSAAGDILRRDLPPQRQAHGPEAPQAWIHRAALAQEECIYGLGERAAPLDLRGGKYQMWNSDPGGSYGPGVDPLYIGIPAYTGLHSGGSYLAFYENSFRAEFCAGLPPLEAPAQAEQVIEARFEDGQLRYYFIPGPPRRALERYTELTGRPPLPPRWALGYHQCRWGYRTESDVRQVVEGFKHHDLPLDAIHLDIDYMDGFRVFTADPERFPDLKRLAADLSQDGVQLVAILDPGVKEEPGYPVYDQGQAAGAFCALPDGKLAVGQAWPGRVVFPDFTSPEVRRWWGQQYTFLLERGVAGFWHDMNEPASFTAWGSMTLPLPTRHALEGRGGDHRQAHNLYGLLMNRAGCEGLRRLRPDRRPWLITRSGWAGLQRYAWAWTGDTDTSWEALRQTIPTVLGLGLTGLPFTGPDIGGFSGNPSPELYLRWFQLAAFLPFFRTHSVTGAAPREPWLFGEPVLSIIRQYLRLRQRLMPYLYTTAWHTSQTGQPAVRPLFWMEPDQAALWKEQDAFLLGDALLAAPVVEEGGIKRQVRLPAGGWYSFWDGEQFNGPGEITLPAPLDCIPLLVRAGCILPMEEAGSLSLHVYPQADGGAEAASGLLYSDAGDGYGAWRVDRFRMEQRGDQLHLTRQTEGDYPFSYQQVFIHVHGGQPRRVEVDGGIDFGEGWIL